MENPPEGAWANRIRPPEQILVDFITALTVGNHWKRYIRFPGHSHPALPSINIYLSNLQAETCAHGLARADTFDEEHGSSEPLGLFVFHFLGSGRKCYTHADRYFTSKGSQAWSLKSHISFTNSFSEFSDQTDRHMEDAKVRYGR